jgi:predicted ABC-type ATPase
MKPLCLVLAGPNGAGKSSLYARLDPPGAFVNADMIAAGMNPENPEAAAFPAGREAMRLIDEYIDARQPFTFETTLSGQQPLKMMRRVREQGYHVALVFVALSSANLHISRVAQRVSLGGHNINSEVIRRRYVSSFEQLTVALLLADEVVIYDNSTEQGYRLCVSLSAGRLVDNHLRKSRAFDRRVAACLQAGLGLAAEGIWRRG